MKEHKFKVNGETFLSGEQAVDAAALLRTAFAGKAIGKDPDKTGVRTGAWPRGRADTL